MNRLTGVLGALLVAGLAGNRAVAGPLVLDAVSLARGGQTALAGIDQSPASPRQPGWRLRFDGFEPFAGTGLVGAAVATEYASARWGCGLAGATLWSPVGVVREIDVGLQWRHRDVIAGCGVQVRGYAFDPYATVWEPMPRAGIGWTRGPQLAIATVVERTAGPAAHPRLRAALEARIVPGIRLAVGLEREPGLESRTSFGIATGASRFCLLAGFDVTTQSCSIGFAWSGERQEVAWGARTHPVLGWSHAWTYERSF